MAVNDDDDDAFETFTVIENIQNRSTEEQKFNLKDVAMSDAEIWRNDYKFIRLRVQENWGDDVNMFHSFSVCGFVCDSQ